jgi:hypothetical protein
MNKSDQNWNPKSKFILLKESSLELKLFKKLPIINKSLKFLGFSISLLIQKLFYRFIKKDLILLDQFKKRELNLLCREHLENRLEIILKRLLILMKKN